MHCPINLSAQSVLRDLFPEHIMPPFASARTTAAEQTAAPHQTWTLGVLVKDLANIITLDPPGSAGVEIRKVVPVTRTEPCCGIRVWGHQPL